MAKGILLGSLQENPLLFGRKLRGWIGATDLEDLTLSMPTPKVDPRRKESTLCKITTTRPHHKEVKP
jgi:hypothetical protein